MLRGRGYMYSRVAAREKGTTAADECPLVSGSPATRGSLGLRYLPPLLPGFPHISDYRTIDGITSDS